MDPNPKASQFFHNEKSLWIRHPQAFIAVYNTSAMFKTNERGKCLSQKSSLTLCVLQYPFHQDRVFCDALSDQQNAFWNSSASSQKITISELKKKIYICIYFLILIYTNTTCIFFLGRNLIIQRVCNSIILFRYNTLHH